MRRTDFRFRRDLLDERIEIGADKQEFRTGILDHKGDLGRREAEVHRHQHHVDLGGAEPELEEGRPVLGKDGDAPLPPDALGDQAVGHLIGRGDQARHR